MTTPTSIYKNDFLWYSPADWIFPRGDGMYDWRFTRATHHEVGSRLNLSNRYSHPMSEGTNIVVRSLNTHRMTLLTQHITGSILDQRVSDPFYVNSNFSFTLSLKNHYFPSC